MESWSPARPLGGASWVRVWANGAAAASGSTAVVTGGQAWTRVLGRQTLKTREAVVNPGDPGRRSCQGWLHPFHRASLQVPGCRDGAGDQALGLPWVEGVAEAWGWKSTCSTV